jgi:glycosyltransferase involved in cell wall biosynthesis
MNNRRLRVAWDNSMAGRDRAGTGRYSAGVTTELRKNTGLDLEVISGPQRNGSAPGSLVRGAQIARDLLWYHCCLPHSLGHTHFDVFHGPAFVLPLWCPCPSVVTVHDLTTRIFSEHFDSRWRVYVNTLMPRVLSMASAIICVSEHTKADLLRFYRLSPNKVHVIYNGVDHERFHPRGALLSESITGLGIREGYLLHVGTLSYRKNISVLLRAIAHLRSQGVWDNRQLVLAGGGHRGLKGFHEISDNIRDLQLENIVVQAGYVPDANLPGLYAHAAILVMPSLYEGFGFPVLESMAVGTPVIASNTSSLPEVSRDAAILFPPQDYQGLSAAIEEVLRNKRLAEELRWKGFARAAEFTWQRTAEQTVKVYRSVSA